MVTNGLQPQPVLLAPEEMGGLLAGAEWVTFLGETAGENEGAAYFAVGLPAGGDEPPEGLAARGVFRELRSVGTSLDADHASLLAYARAMAYWQQRHRFCGECGSPAASAEGGHQRACTNPECRAYHFPRTDPAIIVRVTAGGGERILLGRKAEWGERRFSIIAGFVEPGESLEMTVAREVLEETGVQVEQVCYFASQPWPFPSSLMLGFTARATSEEIQLNDGELEEAHWFSRQEIARGLQEGTMGLPSSLSISYRLIESWFDAGALGPLNALTGERPAGSAKRA